MNRQLPARDGLLGNVAVAVWGAVPLSLGVGVWLDVGGEWEFPA